MADTPSINTGSLLGSNKPTDKPVIKTINKPEAEAKPVVPKDPKGMFDWADAKQHKVVEGESLYDIAQKYCVALQQLRYFNHINKATMHIRVGQTIYIPNKPIEVPYGV